MGVTLGYGTFADFIASDPELSIYRSFLKLSSRNLLYQQSEILSLEHKFSELDADDEKTQNLDEILSAKCWESMQTRASEGSAREKQRMELLEELRIKTKEYRKQTPRPEYGAWPTDFLTSGLTQDESLLRQSLILKLSQPKNRVFRAFRGWFEAEQPFVGYGRDMFSLMGDSVTLQSPTNTDPLTNTFENLYGRFLPVSGQWRRVDEPFTSCQN